MKISQIDETRLSTLGRGLRAMAPKMITMENDRKLFGLEKGLLSALLFSVEYRNRDDPWNVLIYAGSHRDSEKIINIKLL